MAKSAASSAARGRSGLRAESFSTNPPRELPKRRGTELGMLGFATVLVISAFILIEINQSHDLSLRILWYALAYMGLLTVAHLAVRRWAPYADPIILPCVALLNGLGIVTIYRLDLANATQATRSGEDFASQAPNQIMYSAVGLVLFIAVLRLVDDHRTLTRYSYICGFVGVAALALPAVLPASMSEANGSKVWVKLGFVSIQPAEFAKILLMIFFASFLVSKRELFMTAGKKFLGVELPRGRDLGPILIAALACLCVLVLEKDLGMSLLFFGIVLVMIYVATERAVWVVLGLSMFVVGCLLAYQLFGHVQNRVTNWLDPLATYDDPGGGYQVAQSLFGLGTGGLFGTGLGNGRPDMVPEAQTDFIMSAFGEELGFVGFAAVLMLFLIIGSRGLRSALAARDSFGKLLGGGLAFAIVLQVFVIIGGITNLIPMTGITTPFMSGGGSSLLANYILIALLLRISDAARRPAKKRDSQPQMRPPQQSSIADTATVHAARPGNSGPAAEGAHGPEGSAGGYA